MRQKPHFALYSGQSRDSVISIACGVIEYVDSSAHRFEFGNQNEKRSVEPDGGASDGERSLGESFVVAAC